MSSEERAEMPSSSGLNGRSMPSGRDKEPESGWLPIEDRLSAPPAGQPEDSAADVGLAAGDEDGWLAIDDRTADAAGQAPVAESRASAAAPDGGDDLLFIDDRLTTARERRRRQDTERHSRLQSELARFSKAAQRLAPEGVEPPPLSAAEMLALAQRILGPLYPRLEAAIRQNLEAGYLNPDVWRGMWYVGNYLLRAQAGAVRRRLEGQYVVDEYGLDEEFLEVVLPLVQCFYRYYWRVEVTGSENVPAAGRALLVSNHSGVLPFDGAMISAAVLNESESHRLVRALVATWFPTLPFVSILLQKTGQIQASPHNALRLLEREELVCVFPEGYKGVGKLYRDRYQLARFGRGGFIRVAVRAGAPIIPVAVVGAEEIYPVIGRTEPLARLLGFPFFPITPTFPWLGLLGLAPLPSKWTIDFGQPIEMDAFGARAAANPLLVSQLTERVRSTIQKMLLARLARRRSIFL